MQVLKVLVGVTVLSGRDFRMGRDECISLFLYISLCLSFAHLRTIQLYKGRKYFGREDFLGTGHIPVLFENRRWCPILYLIKPKH